MKKLYETPAFKEKHILNAKKEEPLCTKIEYYIEGEYIDENSRVSIKKEDWEGMLEAMSKDLAAVPYEKLDVHAGYNMEDDSIIIVLSYKEKDQFGEDKENVYTMTPDDKNTVAFLKDKGYMK